ncbi:MAG TPA: PAS domain S-box protein [Devosia sp.]|jgi:PAS domain S-box-containing protein|nr:PAS domain S-box protein [Devosia sp.]
MQAERVDLDEGERIIEARLAAIIDSSFDAVIAKDLNSIITDWNPAAERMFGYSADEAIGRSITMLIPPHLQSEETDIIRRIRANERVESYETVRLRKDGSTVFVSLTVSPIRNPRGEVVGASKIARDITQTKESERRIQVLLREINHRVKNQYAVILSLIRETGLSSVSIDEFQQKIRTRIASLAASHDLLVRSEWTGSTLAELVNAQLAPFGHEQLVTISGPLVSVSPNAVQNLGMAFHELGTNSAKYGVLAGRSGSVTVSWSLSRGAEPELTVNWDEAFDEPLELEPQSGRGFGTVVLERVTPVALNGRARASRTRSGITWTLEAPANSVLMQEAGADGDG